MVNAALTDDPRSCERTALLPLLQVAVGADNTRVYTVDYQQNRLRAITVFPATSPATWASSSNRNGLDAAVGVTADALGNAYVAGSRYVGEKGGDEDWQAYVHKLNTMGTVLWEVASVGTRGARALAKTPNCCFRSSSEPLGAFDH